MARLTKEEWQVARDRWESSDISHEALALEIGVSQQAVSGQAKRNNWVRNVVNNVVDVVSNVVATESKSNQTLLESSVDDVVENVVDVVNERKNGRPTNFKSEYCQQIIDYFSNNEAYEILEHESDETRRKAFLNRPLTIYGFAQKIGVDYTTLYRWANNKDENGKLENPDFCKAYKRAMDMQCAMLIEGGLSNVYNAHITTLILKNNHGFKEVQTVEHDVAETKEFENKLDSIFSHSMKYLRAIFPCALFSTIDNSLAISSEMK